MRRNFVITIAVILLAISALVYLAHYSIFQDAHHIFIYLVGDLAFLPIEVLLVVIVIERILARREKQQMLQKLNMEVGVFFSEVGNILLGSLLGSFKNDHEIRQQLCINGSWTPKDFKKAMVSACSMKLGADVHSIKLQDLKAFLMQKRPFLLGLLENPNLLEHEGFTNLLWAVFHLAEELEARPVVEHLPESDLKHLAGDIDRFYGLLATEWLAYVQHLKANYPYLFSMIMRTHPFQEHPSPVVTG